MLVEIPYLIDCTAYISSLLNFYSFFLFINPFERLWLLLGAF
jgi:hypothetical protein